MEGQKKSGFLYRYRVDASPWWNVLKWNVSFLKEPPWSQCITHRTLLKIKVRKGEFLQRCHRRTNFGSSKNLSLSSSEQNQFFLSLKNILITKIIFFHHKEPFVQWKCSMEVKGSWWNHWCQHRTLYL